MSRRSLTGSQTATLAEARAMLRAAVEEASSGRAFACRQAAQKVWLAATTAADAVAGPRSSRQQVIDAFREAWGAKGERVALNINAALHVGVHYSNALCTPGLIDEHVRAIRPLLSGRTIRDPQMRARLRGKR
jgi:hypothetical protein